MELIELEQRHAALLKESGDIINKAGEESRDLTEDEQKTITAKQAEARTVKTSVTLLKEQQSEERHLAAPRNEPVRPDPNAGPDEGDRRSSPYIGMEAKDVGRYSLTRAILAAAEKDWRGAGLEHEASDAVAKATGKSARGFFVPYDVLNPPVEQRDLLKGTATAGGHTIDTELHSEQFIDMLRNSMRVREAGATVLSGLVGDIAIPRQTGGGTVFWVAENTALTESQQAFDQVALAPKSAGAFTDFSRKLLLQSTLDIESFVRRDLAAVIALELDRVGLHGSGASNQPTGIAATSGIGLVAIATNGGPPLWAHIINLETEVSQDNADVGRLAYISNTKVRGKLKQTEKAASTGLWVWTETDTPLNGYRGLVTNQVSSTLTKGTASGICSAIFFGNWADLLIGMWGGLDILVDPFTGGIAGTIRVIAFQDVDIAVRHPESFAWVADALTT